MVDKPVGHLFQVEAGLHSEKLLLLRAGIGVIDMVHEPALEDDLDLLGETLLPLSRSLLRRLGLLDGWERFLPFYFIHPEDFEL